MNGPRNLLIVVIVVIVLVLILTPYYIVEEGQQAVVIRFGKIIHISHQAGLKFKMPLVDKILYYPEKVLSWDGDAQLYPTEENQYIWVDITARWRIKDPKIFYERLTEIDVAQGRLDQLINSSARDVIAGHSLREAVRNSNLINEVLQKDVYSSQTGPTEEGETATKVRTFTRVTYEAIRKGRQKLSDEMLVSARKGTAELGIDLIDVVIRQIKYSDDITQNVYRQMIKERNQLAQAFRSDGEGEKARWMGKMDKELRTIRSTAEKEAKEIKSKADAESLQIRNKAYGQDPEFAEFWMALQEYEKLLPKIKKTLSTDSEFFKYFYNKSAK
jgi:membrane protease subunit HflC